MLPALIAALVPLLGIIIKSPLLVALGIILVIGLATSIPIWILGVGALIMFIALRKK